MDLYELIESKTILHASSKSNVKKVKGSFFDHLIAKRISFGGNQERSRFPK